MEGQKKIKITVAVITVCFALLLSISYAFIDSTLTGVKKQVITAGSLQLSLLEGDKLILEDALPMHDEVGMIQDSFKFTLYNKGNTILGYRIYLENIATSNQLDTSLVRYNLIKDGSLLKGPDYVSVLEENNYLLEEGFISAGDKYSYELRLWIGSEIIDNSLISGKSLCYKLKLEVSQSTGNEDIIIAATLDGVPVKEFPTISDNYGIESVDCDNNAVGSFKTNNWSFVIENFTKTGTTCTAKFSTQIAKEETIISENVTKEELQEEIQNKEQVITAINNFGGDLSSSATMEEIANYINTSLVKIPPKQTGTITTGTITAKKSKTITIVFPQKFTKKSSLTLTAGGVAYNYYKYSVSSINQSQCVITFTSDESNAGQNWTINWTATIS